MTDDKREIREVIENWALWRDAGEWDKFATTWHRTGQMSATWFRGPAAKFIEASRAGFERGVVILHFLGGSTIQTAGARAIAQTKMTITQRGTVHGEEVDVTCTGRFFDLLAFDDDRWSIVRRQPIYERDRLDVVDPSATVQLDTTALNEFPVGYRHLAYLQRAEGFEVRNGLPGLGNRATDELYARGRAWLAGDDLRSEDA